MDQNKFQSFLLILLQLSRKKGKPLIVRLLCYAQKRPVCLWTLTTLFTLNQSLWFQHHIFLFWASLFVRVWLSSSGASDSPSTDKSNSHSTISSRCNKSYTRSDSPVPPPAGGHLPCMSKTGYRASWCRDQWPHSGCQDQTLFLPKAHRHYT